MLTLIAACTIGPTAKQYAVESDFFDGKMKIHEGPGVKDYMNVLDDVTYYDKVDGYGFSNEKDEEGKPIEIRFANNGIAYLSGHTDYRLPTGAEKSLMADIEENYGSADAVEQQLIRQALEKSAFTAGQFMSVFDALSKNRSFLQELIYDQANNGQYQMKFKEERVVDVATGEEKVVKVSDRIPCEGSDPDCIGGYLRTEGSALKLYGITLFNFTVKQLKGEESIENAIASNLQRSNRMEELAIEAREAQVNAATTAENAKAKVAEEQAARDIAVAQAQKQTAVAEEELKQKKFQADAEFYQKQKEAQADKLKVAAGLTPVQKAQIQKERDIGVAAELAKYQGPKIIVNGNGSQGSLETTAQMKELILLMKQIDDQ